MHRQTPALTLRGGAKSYCPFALRLYNYPLHKHVCNNSAMDHKV